MPFYSKQSRAERPVANPRVKKKVIVAGAGIAGLCCAYELMKMAHEVVWYLKPQADTAEPFICS